MLHVLVDKFTLLGAQFQYWMIIPIGALLLSALFHVLRSNPNDPDRGRG